MLKKELKFDDFINDVEPRYRDFALRTHDYMLGSGCKLKMQLAKNGYVISYTHGKTKHTIMNFVFRKSGLVARIYGGNAEDAFLASLTDNMKKAIEQAPMCKRFAEPPKCGPKCSGYAFTLNGARHQKCRYSCFMFEVDDESIPFINGFLENELKARGNAKDKPA